MPENLWKLRQRKNFTVSQLAARSGVPARVIDEYEQGRPIRTPDLPRLARALYVEPDAIRLRSEPPPAPRAPVTIGPAEPATPATPATPAEPRAPKPPKTPKPPKVPKPPPPPSPARPSQLAHLLVLAAQQGLDQPALEAQLGKPCDTLTLPEAREWLKKFMASSPRREPSATLPQVDGAPSPIHRRRAHLPEAADTYELNYLETLKQSAAIVEFVLINGDHLAGRVTGFSPYIITIQNDEQQELTVQKLGLVYYRRQV